MRWSLHGPIECILECMILLSAALWAAFYDGRFFFFLFLVYIFNYLLAHGRTQHNMYEYLDYGRMS